MENDLKGNENNFELTGGSSYGGFELPGVNCIPFGFISEVTQLSELKILFPRKKSYAKDRRFMYTHSEIR